MFAANPELFAPAVPVEDIVLRNYQQESIEGLRDNIRNGIDSQILAAFVGAGKCHGKGTRVIMADGELREVELIQVGDKLASPTGGFRTVLSLGRGREMMYRVTPVKGDSYTVNESHLLSVRRSGTGSQIYAGKRIFSGEIATISAGDFHGIEKKRRDYLKGWRPRLVHFGRFFDSHVIPPYILGAWLGDGTARSPSITKPKCKMVDEWIAWGDSLGCYVREEEGRGCSTWHLATARGQVNPALEFLRCLGVLNQKHIPHDYMIGPENERMEIIAGLLDSDGCVSRGGYDWISKDERMANDFAFVCRSVGLACYVSKQRKGIKSTGFSADYFRCSITGDCERIPCRDKKAPPRRQIKDHLVTGIDIEQIGVGDYYGFELDGDHLYLLSDFTVCHNTVMAAYLLREAFRKGCRGYFVVDRLSLLGQTSAMFDRYGIPHGVVQSKHPRNFPDEQIQIASIQTVASRGWNKSDVIFYDECHVIYKTVTDRILMGGAKMIGLSATPFTRGLGRYYKAIVNVRTGNQLTADGFLVPFRVFAANEPDMKGVKTVAGEWVEGETSDRAKVIIGDVVKEFLQHAGTRKGIAFGVDVSHCEEMRKQFAAAGVVTALYTYMTPDDEREEMLREFRKPDSKIRLLISVSALSRGFDVPSVEVIIMCRPLKSSFAEFVQIIGRGLRSHPSKKDCIILDLAGNFMRHYGELVDFMENGWHELDDGKKKEKDDKKPEPRKPVKCPECFYVFNGGKTCPNCGHVFERIFTRSKTDIIHQDGELGEFDLSTKRITQPVNIFIKDILRKYKPEHKPALEWEVNELRGFGIDIPEGPMSAFQVIRIKERYRKKRLSIANQTAAAKRS